MLLGLLVLLFLTDSLWALSVGTIFLRAFWGPEIPPKHGFWGPST